MGKNPFQNFVVRFHTGDTLFAEGDRGATMFIVQSGRIRLYRQNNGTARELGVMEKGDFFGEMSILEGLPRTSHAEAVEDSELIEIGSTTFDKMIKSNIEIAIRLLRKLSIRLRETERRLDEVQVNGAAVLPRSATPPSAAATADAVGGIRLELEEGSTVFTLSGGETMIGRYDPVTELRPDVDLSDHDLKRSVSRRHARIVPQDDGFAIVEEVGALNGTFVNERLLVTGKPTSLQDGDEMGVGVVRLRFHVFGA